MKTSRAIWIVALALGACLVAGCDSGAREVPSTEPAADAPTSTPRVSAWNTYHGDASLDGVAKTDLANELTLLWRFMAEAPVRTTPVAEGGRIYFANVHGKLFAVDTHGTEVWSRTLAQEDARDTPDAAHHFDAPLACFGTTLLAGSAEGVLFALDAASGSVRWQVDLDGTILGTPNAEVLSSDDAGNVSGRAYAIEQGSGVLHCVDLATGEPLWRAQGVDRCDGSPGIGGGVVVFGSCAAALHIFSAEDGRLLREVAIDEESQVAGGVAVVDDAAISGSRSGKVLEVNTKTGERVWLNADSSNEVFTTPAVSGEWVVFAGSDARLYALDRRTGRARYTVPMASPESSPVLAGDKVVVTGNGVLLLLRLEDGHELWAYGVSDKITSPAVFSGMVVVGSDDGTVAAFG